MKYLFLPIIILLITTSVFAYSGDLKNFKLTANGYEEKDSFKIASELSLVHDDGRPMIISYHGGKLKGQTITKGTPSNGKGNLKIELSRGHETMTANFDLKEIGVISRTENSIIVNNIATGKLSYTYKDMTFSKTMTKNLVYEFNQKSKIIKFPELGINLEVK